MRGALQIGLRANDKIYINGAVLSVDRKVRIALLNETTFLLGKQVMQLEETTTPIRKLYFLVQSTLIDPKISASLRPAIGAAITAIASESPCAEVIAAMERVARMIDEGRPFEALKAVRSSMAQEESTGSVPSAVESTRNVA